MTLTRGYGEKLPLADWLVTRIFPFEALSRKRMSIGVPCSGSLRCCAADGFVYRYVYAHSGRLPRRHGDASRQTCPTASRVTIRPSLKRRLGTERRNKCDATRKRRTDASSPTPLHAQYTSTVSLVRAIADYARENELHMHVHLSESEAEHENCKALHGKTPTKFFTDLGLFDVPTTVAHAVYIEGEDYDLLLDKGVSLCHAPSSNLKLGSGLADVKSWRDHGLRVTIGTDGAEQQQPRYDRGGHLGIVSCERLTSRPAPLLNR